MPKKGQRGEINSFVKGIITEASPLNFPPDASRDEQNFELNRDGSRDRRLGMDFEDSHVQVTTGLATTDAVEAGLNTYNWYNVAGDASKEFLAVQVNRKLHFFNLGADNLSAGGALGSLTLSSFSDNKRYSFACIEGRLVVVQGGEYVAIVEYTAPSTFTATYVTLRVRDVWGVEVSGTQYETDPQYRGASDPRHIYNLQNQSWGIPRKNSTGALLDPLDMYFAEHKVYPSNTETVWPGLQYQPVAAGQDPFERMFPKLYQEVLGADTKASKGYFIIDLLRRGQSRVTSFVNNYARSTTYSAGSPAVLGPLIPTVGDDGSTITYAQEVITAAVPEGTSPRLSTSNITLPTDLTSGGASVVKEYAGRVFFAGFDGEVTGGDKRSPNLSNFVVFSQLVRNISDINKCYQEGDPTSRENSDVVDTDGGFIRIDGAKRIIALRDLGTQLVVIAENGVWSVTGGSDYGFSASNYKVSKMSSFGGLSESSVVQEGEQLYYWAKDGIYAIGKDKMGDLSVQNISQQTIQKLYEALPNASKETAIGAYDPFSKRIRWMFKTGTLFNSTSVTKELVLDTVLGAFTVLRVYQPVGGPELIGLFPSSSFLEGSEFERVLVGLNQVAVDSEDVGLTLPIRTTSPQSIRYVALTSIAGSVFISFALYQNGRFLDWESYNGVGEDAYAYLITGAFTGGDTGMIKQVPYVIMHFRRTEDGVTETLEPDNPSSCYVRSMWDWADSIVSRKWSQRFQAYRYRKALFVTSTLDSYDNGFETVVTKNKLRGRGRAFSLYIETEAGKDCRLLGWNLTINGNPTT